MSLQALYLSHVAAKLDVFLPLMETLGYDDLVISSGRIKVRFQDDACYPFKAGGYFAEWLPLTRRPDSYLWLSLTRRPRLLLNNAEDLYHTPPPTLPAGWAQPFDIDYFQTHEQLVRQLRVDRSRAAYLGEDNVLGFAQAQCNPQQLINHLDYLRRFKSEYEHACVREANRIAVSAHSAAHESFTERGSEQDILRAYLQDCRCQENDLPYPVIAGINEHAAILHHFALDGRPPFQHRSLLIDAGIDVNGYASDVTRTHAYDGNCDFAAMIGLMDLKQRELVAQLGYGDCSIELHRLSHRKVAEVLVAFDVIRASEEEAVLSGLTGSFYPHGVGHGLGVNVHERGAQLALPSGATIPSPEDYPRLRVTAPLSASQIVTVEPGLYFVPALLDRLRGSRLGRQVNWSRVADFLPYGGLRIEDNIILHKDGSVENLTRNAHELMHRAQRSNTH